MLALIKIFICVYTWLCKLETLKKVIMIIDLQRFMIKYVYAYQFADRLVYFNPVYLQRIPLLGPLYYRPP